VIDDLRIPDDCDPSRWPFCEARARAAAAWSAFPDPPRYNGADAALRRRRPIRNQVKEAEERRARQRADASPTAVAS